MTMIDRAKYGRKDGERSSSAVQGLETVTQRSRVSGEKFDVPFGTGPSASKGRGPDADRRTARLVDWKSQRLMGEPALVRRGVLWSGQREIFLWWSLRRREVSNG